MTQRSLEKRIIRVEPMCFPHPPSSSSMRSGIESAQQGIESLEQRIESLEQQGISLPQQGISSHQQRISHQKSNILNSMPTIKRCTTMQKNHKSQLHFGHNHTRDLLQVMTAGRTKRRRRIRRASETTRIITTRSSQSQLFNFLIILFFSLSISSSLPYCIASSAIKNSHDSTAYSTPLQTNHDPLAIYSHKLSLFLPDQNQKHNEDNRDVDDDEASAKLQSRTLFDYVVNATSRDDYKNIIEEQVKHFQDLQNRDDLNSFSNQNSKSNNLSKEIRNSPSHAADIDIDSLKFNCHGSNCPKFEFLHQSEGSDLLQDFVPQVLPRWDERNTFRRRKVRSSDEDGNDGVKSLSGHLGPLRIFKYVHHPDELLKKPTDTPAIKEASSVDSKVNQTLKEINGEKDREEKEELEEKDQVKNPNISRESTTSSTTERSFIPNSFFIKDNDDDESNLNSNETILINGTLEDGFRLRRSPFRPHWRDHRLYTHAREALYDLPPPPLLHPPPPPGLTPVAIPMPPSSNMGMGRPKFIPLNNPPPPMAIMAVPVALPYNNNNNINNHNNNINNHNNNINNHNNNINNHNNNINNHNNNINNNGQNINQMAASDRTFTTNPGNDPQSPQEQSTFRFPSYQRPFSKRPPHHDKTGNGHRRPHHPKPRHRNRPGSGPIPSVMPAPKPMPLSRPRPQIQPAPSGRTRGTLRRPPPPSGFMPHIPPGHSPMGPPQIGPTVPYSYPKHAANIQDILTFFKTDDDNEIPDSKPPIGSPSMPALSAGGGFSSEFQDIHNSLLKDIKDFAKRPTMLGKENSDEGEGNPAPSPRPSVLPLIDPDDPMDDPLDPKPKPVREMIQYRPLEPEISKEEQEAPSRHSGTKNRGHYEESRNNGYNYDDDRDDRSSNSNNNNNNRNRHEQSHTSRERDKNKRRPEDEYSKEEEQQAYRPRDRDGDGYKSGQRNHHHDRYKNHQNFKNDDAYSDERPYSDNLHTPNSNAYNRERERNRERDQDRDYGYNSHYYNTNNNKAHTKAHRPHKSHRQRPHRRNRHKSNNNKSYAGSTVNERFRSSNQQFDRDLAANSRERERIRQSAEFIPSPTKISTTMEQAYYQQRNRPIIIKRPYQPYRPIDVKKVEEQRKQEDKYWNTVGTVNLQQANKVSPAYHRQPTIQKHYHYYGMNNMHPPGAPNNVDRSISTSTRRPYIQSSSGEEDILEIHTGSGLGEVSTTPVYPIGGHGGHNFQNDSEKKARLQKMYMDYLQRKLEAQAEAQAEAMLTTPTPTAKPNNNKRPMRMKIHIYPNEKVQVVDQHHNNHNIYPLNHHSSNNHPFGSASASNNNVFHPGQAGNIHRSYGHFHIPTPSMVPPVVHTQSIIPSQSNNIHGSPHHRPNSVQSTVDKNKNVVLHLHVHRRNDDDGHLEMSGSETVTSTVKPLTYEDIYQSSNRGDQMGDNSPSNDDSDMDNIDQSNNNNNHNTNHNNNHNNHHIMQSKSNEGQIEQVESDKSLSMELPIHQDKIEDVLSTLLKLRE